MKHYTDMEPRAERVVLAQTAAEESTKNARKMRLMIKQAEEEARRMSK